MQTKLDRLSERKLRPGQLTENRNTFLRMENGGGINEDGIMVDDVRVHRLVGHESKGVTRTQAGSHIKWVRMEVRKDRPTLPKCRKVAQSFGDSTLKYLVKL